MAKKGKAASGGEKDKGGRPARVLDDKEIAQVEALSRYLTISQIADFLGIGERTFDAIRERQPEVSAAYKRGKAGATHSIAKNLVEQAESGNMTAIIFYLKTQAGWRETWDVTSGDAPLMPPAIHVVAAGSRPPDADQ